jgi:hypothetical protein
MVEVVKGWTLPDRQGGEVACPRWSLASRWQGLRLFQSLSKKWVGC